MKAILVCVQARLCCATHVQVRGQPAGITLDLVFDSVGPGD